MKKYIRQNRYIMYDGKQIQLEDGETKPQAIARYKDNLAKGEAARAEEARLAKIEKELKQRERKMTPRYKDGTIVITKYHKFYKVYDGYYSEYGDTIYYDAVPCTLDGKWSVPEEDWMDMSVELDQRDIQRKVN